MEQQLPAILRANEAYQRGDFHATPRTPQPSRGLVILACMDTRLDLFRACGLEVGEAHILRNAGGRATRDAVRSLVVSSHLLGTREIGLIHHTNCGLEGLTNDEVEARTGVGGIDYLTFTDVEQSVRDDVKVVQAAGLPADATVWGAVYEVDTGALRIVVS